MGPPTVKRSPTTRRRGASSRSGQALVEYVLVVALVAVTLIAALALFRAAVAAHVIEPVNTATECASPGNGASNPGHSGGVPPGQCKKAG